ERNMRHNVLARADTAQDAAGVIAEEARRRHFVAVLGTLLFYARKARSYLYALDGVDAHQAMGQFGIEAIEHRLAQTYRQAGRDERDARPDGVAFLAECGHVRFHFGNLV